MALPKVTDQFLFLQYVPSLDSNASTEGTSTTHCGRLLMGGYLYAEEIFLILLSAL